MKLLAYERLDEFLARDHPGESARHARLVGADRFIDSGYYDIHRFWGEHSVSPDAIHLNYLPEPFHLSDKRIAAYANEIAAYLREQGRLYDGPPVMRLERLDLSSHPAQAVVQAASYPEQAGSSFAMDAPHPLFADYGGTLRDYYLREYRETRFAHNPLCACLGVCGQLIIRDNGKLFMLLVRRSARLASLENSIGPSVAGSVDFVEGLATMADLMRVSFAQEIEEELGLLESEYQLIPLAIAREFFRGDRPQLFGLIIAEIGSGELKKRLEACREHGEFDQYELVPLGEGRLALDQIARLNFEAKLSYYLAEEYLSDKSNLNPYFT